MAIKTVSTKQEQQSTHISEEAPDLAQLVEKIGKNKDKEAFMVLFDHFAPRLKSFLMRGKFSEDVAEEIVQETLLTVWRRAKSYNSKKANPSTWIFTIARNKKIDYLRKHNKPTPIAEDLEFSQLIHPNDAYIRKERQQLFETMVKNLPEEQAEMLRKSFYEDKSHQEIADETNIPLGTVKSRIRMALQKLKLELGENAKLETL